MSKIIRYVKMNPFISFFCFYILLSTVLKSIAAIDICIPCIWKSIFGVQCPGCGLTTAFISLIELDYRKAFESNWLIYIITPFGFYYLTQDYIKFSRKYNA
jgi:hypothetical protein